MIGQFKPLLDRYGVRAYFNGHEHNLEHIAVDGVHYLTCGAGSAPNPGGTPPPPPFRSPATITASSPCSSPPTPCTLPASTIPGPRSTRPISRAPHSRIGCP